jgi:hypothetical protein
VVYIVPREDTVLGNANNRDLHDTDIIGNISYGIGSFVGVIEQILDAFFSPTGDNEETTKLRAAGNGIYDMMDEYPKSWEHIDDINATIRGTLTVYGDALRKIGKDREAVLAAVSMDRRSPFCTYMFDHLWGPSSYDIRDTPNFQHLCNYATYGCTTLLAANIAEEATSRYTGTEVWFEGEYAIVPAEYSRYE